MTDEFKNLSLGEWAKAAATVVLTRRDDLTIVETKRETGLDFHVRIEREEKSMRLTFGVLLRAIPSPTTGENANKILGPTIGQFLGMRKFTYPVCLLFFTMSENQEFFSWLAEPTLIDGIPKLVHHDSTQCVRLTDQRLDQIVEEVINWYDAVETVLIA